MCRIALWVSVGDAVTSFTFVRNWVKTHPPKQPHNAIRHKTGGQMVKRTFSHNVTSVMSQNNPVGIESFVCKSFILFQYICIAAGHANEKAL